jgi:hypothetical protein
MQIVKKISFVLFLVFFTSCEKNEDDYIFENMRFENINELTIKEVVEIEKEMGSTERTENNTFGIDTDYYPNKNEFLLSFPKVFERNQKKLGLETDYFYTNNDGLIKVIFYEWNSKYGNLINFESDTLKKNISEKKIYQNKFNYLKYKINEKLGKATRVNIEKQNDTVSDYINNFEWKKNNLNVSLSLHYGENNFNQIRLVIHKK